MKTMPKLLLPSLLAVSCLSVGCKQYTPGDPGSAALDFVRSDHYPNMVIEYDYIDGFKVDDSTQTAIESEIGQLVDKLGTVEAITGDAIPATAEDPAYSLDDVRLIEEEYRDYFTKGKTAALYILHLNGHYETDTELEKTLGLAYSESSVVVFQQALMETCELKKQFAPSEYVDLLCPTGEAVTIVHEIGHILGLVDNGIPMTVSHKDIEAYGDHCMNPQCIMFWSNNTKAMLQYVIQRYQNGNENAVAFDDDCLNDLTFAREILER